MVFNYKDCLKKGLLRKIPASKEKALRSIKKAEKWLGEADKAFNSATNFLARMKALLDSLDNSS